MSNRDLESIESVAQSCRVSQSTIYRWIRQGKLIAAKQDGRMIIPTDIKSNIDFIIEQIRYRPFRPVMPWVHQSIKGYSQWHELLDQFCWLIKISYSAIDDIKKKRFRTDRLFARYIEDQNITLEAIKRVFASNTSPNRRLITSDLKRGWYNETAFVFPLKRSTLGQSFGDISLNKEISEVRFAFPSWRIVTAYYSVYFYLRSVCLHMTDKFRLEEHGATIATFKYSLLQPLERAVWKFPFDISFDPRRRYYPSRLYLTKLRHAKFAYSAHPRTPHYSPEKIVANIHRAFTRAGKTRKKPLVYTLFDYLHDFRIWANYLDIDNLLNLKGAGYKAFLDQNISLTLFFIAGISELCFIAVFGSREYADELQSFYDIFVTSTPDLEEEFVKTPLFQRLAVYNQLGLVPETITLRRKHDMNAVNLSDQGS